MELWIARDLNNELYVYNGKPMKKEDRFVPIPYKRDYFRIDNGLFPEVTFGNSPQKVELKLL